MQTVQKICCVNNAGFVMYFSIEYLDMSTGQWTNLPGSDTSNYPIDQSRTTDLSTLNLSAGTLVRPLVHADGGDNNPGNAVVTYQDNGQVATYTVQGTTLDYSVTLMGSYVAL